MNHFLQSRNNVILGSEREEINEYNLNIFIDYYLNLDFIHIYNVLWSKSRENRPVDSVAYQLGPICNIIQECDITSCNTILPHNFILYLCKIHFMVLLLLMYVFFCYKYKRASF